MIKKYVKMIISEKKENKLAAIIFLGKNSWLFFWGLLFLNFSCSCGDKNIADKINN